MPSFFVQMLELCERLNTFLNDYELYSNQYTLEINQEKNKIKQECNQKKSEIYNLMNEISTVSDEYSKIAGMPVVHIQCPNPNHLPDSINTYVNRVKNGVTRLKKIPNIVELKKGGNINVLELVFQYIFFLIASDIVFHFISIWYNSANRNPLFDTSYIKATPLGFLDTSLFAILIVIIFNLNKQKIQYKIIGLSAFSGLIIHFIISNFNDWIIRFVLECLSLIVIIWFALFIQKKINEDQIKLDLSKFVVDYANAKQKLTQEVQNIESSYQKQYSKICADHQRKCDQLDTVFAKEYDRISQDINRYNTNTGFIGQEWNNAIWSKWAPSATIPSDIAIGKLIHTQYRNHPDKQLPIIAVHPFAPGKNILFISEDNSGRQNIHQAMQSLCLRFFATLPSGRALLYFIDPLNLGGNLQGFTTLSYDKKYLINNGAIIQSQEISTHLNELLKHIRRINEEKLQNQYQTIEEYNVANPRLIEPYRFLVFFDLPVEYRNFLNPIETIAQTGPRCGVYSIIHIPKNTYTNHFINMRQLYSLIQQNSNAFKWNDILQTQAYDVVLDLPPSPTTFNRIVKSVSVNIIQNEVIEFDELFS